MLKGVFFDTDQRQLVMEITDRRFVDFDDKGWIVVMTASQGLSVFKGSFEISVGPRPENISRYTVIPRQGTNDLIIDGEGSANSWSYTS